ncbi:[histone H3]-lysine(4) N-trimethyltransferase [Trifolium repens]|nr:[histone H3]-lysine(4) N-trimethyltransferase [Trifolium repens]
MRDNTLPILSFHLKSRSRHLCCNHLYQDFLYPAITRGKVENLIIDLFHSNTLPPSVVLLSSTLSILKLKRITFNEGFPTVIDLPSLKVLHLEIVTFTYIADLHKLVSASPVLHELQTSYLRILTMPPFTLQIKQTPPLPSPPLGIAISSLVRANIIYTDNDTIFGLEWLHNVDHLHIQLNTTPPTIRGVFYNLTHLELIFNFHGEQYTFFKWRWLTKLLQNTPNLQTLIIHELFKVEDDERHLKDFWEAWWEEELVYGFSWVVLAVLIILFKVQN